MIVIVKKDIIPATCEYMKTVSENGFIKKSTYTEHILHS